MKELAIIILTIGAGFMVLTFCAFMWSMILDDMEERKERRRKRDKEWREKMVAQLVEMAKKEKSTN